MKKRDKIIYWVATVWLCLGMASSAIVQLIPLEEELTRMGELEYPSYFLTIIGVWKVFGIIAVLVPGFSLVKEWAYAGFFFLMSGAIFSHLAVGDGAADYFGPTLLIVLTIVSWYFRPAARRVQPI